MISYSIDRYVIIGGIDTHVFISSFALVVQVGKSIIYLLKKPLDLPLPLVKAIKQQTSLSGYVDALTATGLGRRLSDARGVTVFAPSSQAWSELGVVEDYLRLQQEESLQALENVVRYTVVEGVHYAGDIKPGRTVLKTNEGSELVVEKNGDTIYVGEGRLERSEQVGGKVVDKGNQHNMSNNCFSR